MGGSVWELAALEGERVRGEIKRWVSMAVRRNRNGGNRDHGERRGEKREKWMYGSGVLGWVLTAVGKPKSKV